MATIATPFASIEASINADTMRMLANAVATVSLPLAAAGEEMAVIFDNAYQFIELGSGVASSGPAATLLEEAMSEPVRDALEAGGELALLIKGTTYDVVEPMPDGTGMTVLRLRKP